MTNEASIEVVALAKAAGHKAGYNYSDECAGNYFTSLEWAAWTAGWFEGRADREKEICTRYQCALSGARAIYMLERANVSYSPVRKQPASEYGKVGMRRLA